MQNDDHKTEGQAAVRCSVLLGFVFNGFVNRKSLRHLLVGERILTATSRLSNSINTFLVLFAVRCANIWAGKISLKENLSVVGIEVVKNDLAIGHGGTTRN